MSGPGGGARRGAFLAELHRGVLDKRHPLQKSEIIIGRDAAADIRIDEKSVSRRHASIRRHGDRFVLYDLGSHNGTSVNEHHLGNGDQRLLEVNDCIFIGRAVLCFMVAEDRLHLSTDMNIDVITGVPNRRWFLDRLEKSMREARVQHRPLTLSLVGIDDLASINQRFGQRAGDVVLHHVANTIQATLSPAESVSRYRGAVFGVISPDHLDGEVVSRAERLRGLIESQPALMDNDVILVSVSVGATPMMALDQEKLLDVADGALSQAKQRGNCVVRAGVGNEQSEQTERYQRRMVPESLFTQMLRTPAVAFTVYWAGNTGPTKQARLTPLDFELQTAVQRNLSGEELATYPDGGGAVVVAVPRQDGDRVPRLCDAIRASFAQALANRGVNPISLHVTEGIVVASPGQALALAPPPLPTRY